MKELAKFAISYMESYIIYLTDKNYKDFISNQNNKKVLLFHNKKSTPPLFMSLSKMFKNKLDFGEIKWRPNDEENLLIKKFNIDKFPTIGVLKDDKDSFELDVF